MQRTTSYNFAVLIKDIFNMFVEEKGPILPTYERTSPTFEIPLDEIVVTFEDKSHKFEGYKVK